MHRIIALLLSLASCSSGGNFKSDVQSNQVTEMSEQPTHNYNKVVQFELLETLVFPDFSIRCTKEKLIPGPNNAKWTMRTLYFEVTGKHGSKEISWSSGTGSFSNTAFDYNDSDFSLILGAYRDLEAATKSFIPLGKYELMIRKSPTKGEE